MSFLSRLTAPELDAHMAAIDSAAQDARDMGMEIPGIFAAGDQAAAERDTRRGKAA
jgi:hypothetical protein